MDRHACVRYCSALALMFFLAACGGGGGSSGSSSVTNPGPGPGPGPAPASGWSSSDRISNLQNSAFTEIFTPSVALTSQGVGFVAWNEAQFAGGCGQIWVNRNAGGAWSALTRIDTTNQAIDPHVAANTAGAAVVVWIERHWSGAGCTGGISGQELWSSRFSAASGTWSAPLRVSIVAPPDFTTYTFSPAVALDASGRAMAVWIQDGGGAAARSAWFSRFDGANWSAPALLSNGTRNSEEPTLALDGAGNVFALWTQNTNQPDPSVSGGGPQLPNTWAARFAAAAGTWNTPALIGSGDLSGADGTERPHLAVNAGGTAVAVWEERRGLENSIVGSRFSSGTWSAPVPLENNTQQAAFPAVAIDVNGNAQAVWVQKIDATEANNSGYTARMDGTTGIWGAPQLFEQAVEDVSSPQVGLEDSGRALIAWTQFVSGTPPVHAAHYAPASGFDAPVTFPGNSVALAVNAGGTGLLASETTTIETTFIGISIHAEMFRP